jgi:CRISPR-associated endoribonuclease Cas6
MRIHITTTKNASTVPFNYQQKLVGILNKWLGKSNGEHGFMSLYSFSWLYYGRMIEGGLDFPNGAKWFISFYDESKIKTIVKTILDDPAMFSDMFVSDITIEETPDLSNKELFNLASPIFIKRFIKEGNKDKYMQYTFDNSQANELMKETLIHKMRIANLDDDNSLDIKFDLSYAGKKTKLITYKNIRDKANFCPVIIKGKPETKAFAWNVGIGNSTGVGFGAIY